MCFVTQSLNHGGVEKSLELLSKLLVENGCCVTIICMNAEGNMKWTFEKYCNIIQMPGLKNPKEKIINELKKGSFFLAFKKILKSILFKLSHNQYYKQTLLSEILPKYEEDEFDYAIAYHSPFDFPVIYTLNNIKAKKYIYYLHLEMFDSDNKKYIGFENAFARYDKVICVSKDTAKSFIKKYPYYESKVEVIYNLVDDKKIKDLAEEPIELIKRENEWVICTVGRLSNQKGFDIAIDACGILLDKGYNIKWYVCGDGKERSNLESLSTRLNGAFVLLGDKANPYPYIKMADVYAQTSRVEGYCITLAEACILKKPIVTTGFAGAYEQIVSGDTGLIVNTDAQSIADGIMQLLNSKELMNKFKSNVRFQGNLNDIIKIKRLFGIQ